MRGTNFSGNESLKLPTLNMSSGRTYKLCFGNRRTMTDRLFSNTFSRLLTACPPRNHKTTRRTRRTRRQVNQHKALQYMDNRRVRQVRRVDL